MGRSLLGAMVLLTAVVVLVPAALGPQRAHAAANPLLIATVSDPQDISLTDSNGTPVTQLAPGIYDVEVHDNSTSHNFHLFKQPQGSGLNQMTTVPFTGVVTWAAVTLDPGANYHYQCDPHSDFMNGGFTTTGGPPPPPPPPPTPPPQAAPAPR